MHVLRNMVTAVRPGGILLDLQVVRPDPLVESEGRIVCEIDGEPLFLRADAATAAVDAHVGKGVLAEEARDDHDVRCHYPSGADLVDDFEDSQRQLPEAAIEQLRAMTQPFVLRERCRLRRLVRLR